MLLFFLMFLLCLWLLITKAFNVLDPLRHKPHFCDTYHYISQQLEPIDCSCSAEELATRFLKHCEVTLNIVAPFKLSKACPISTKQPPWINDRVRSIRRACGRAERKWKTSKLRSDLDVKKELLKDFNRTVKEERLKYFSQLTATNPHNHKLLFRTINSLIPRPPVIREMCSIERCDSFCSFFVNKVSTIRAQVTPSPFTPLYIELYQTFKSFHSVSQSEQMRLICGVKSSTSSLHILPTRFLKKVSTFLSSDVLAVFKTSLSTRLFRQSLNWLLCNQTLIQII